ncbi:MAG: hypothetical protein V7K21_29760 [Nostoc sp.]|uniref:hypothetical protein n=1 Tax=Nostoc sp. TaxID=1180 RepID=UPI002FF6102D
MSIINVAIASSRINQLNNLATALEDVLKVAKGIILQFCTRLSARQNQGCAMYLDALLY